MANLKRSLNHDDPNQKTSISTKLANPTKCWYLFYLLTNENNDQNNGGQPSIGSVVSFILVMGFDLDKSRLARPHYGSQTRPPRSSRCRANQSGNLSQLAQACREKKYQYQVGIKPN